MIRRAPSARIGQSRDLPRSCGLLVALALLLGIAGSTSGAAAASPATNAEAEALIADGWYDGVLPELRSEVATRVGPQDAYRIEAEFDLWEGEISGTAEVNYVNRTGARMREIYFRLPPNDPFYGDASLEVTLVRVGGRTVTDLDDDLTNKDTVLRVGLEETLAPEESARVEFAFATTLIDEGDGLGRLLGTDWYSGTWLMDGWYPLVAPYVAGEGWWLELGVFPGSFDNALYDVTLTAPDWWTIVATGAEVERVERGESVSRRFVTGPVRGFVVAADNDYVARTATVGGTRITTYGERYNPDSAEAAARALRVAAYSLALYGERFGAYPYEEFDVVVLPYLEGGGFAMPGVVFVSLWYVEQEAPGDGYGYPTYAPDFDFFVSVVAHEVGHQWWGVLIDSDYRQHTFMVEGLTEYLAVQFRGWTEGEAEGERVLITEVAQPYLITLETVGDQVANRTGTTGLGIAHVGIVYGKATLGFLAVHVEIGDDAFYAALRAYAEEFAFGVATPEDLLAAFEDASGRQLDDLWHHWFDEAETTPDEVRDLIRAA